MEDEKRVLSTKDIDLFCDWFVVRVPDVTKRRVLILLGIESAYYTAESRGQKYLTYKISMKARAVAAHFRYDFYHPKRMRK